MELAHPVRLQKYNSVLHLCVAGEFRVKSIYYNFRLGKIKKRNFMVCCYRKFQKSAELIAQWISDARHARTPQENGNQFDTA